MYSVNSSFFCMQSKNIETVTPSCPGVLYTILRKPSFSYHITRFSLASIVITLTGQLAANNSTFFIIA